MPSPYALLVLFEAHLINFLLRRPTFHRFVGYLHKKHRHIRHGVPPEELGGTNLEDPGKAGTVLRYFREEVGKQFDGLRGKGR